MILRRREFLKLLGVAAGAAGATGCGRMWQVPDRLVELALRGPGIEEWRQTICGLCPAGCGLSVRTVDGIPVGLKGNPRHPLNRGGLCPVGQAALELLYSPARLREPLRRGEDGELHPATWDATLVEIGELLTRLRSAEGGPRVAMLTGEPSRLFYDLATRFVNALGSPHIARFQPADTVPFFLSQGREDAPGVDLAGTDLVLSFGLDLYEDGAAPVHAMAATVGSRAAAERAALLHVGTRLSPSASKAEQFVTIRPGSHGAFALGVAHVLVRESDYDRRFVADHASGFEDWTDERGRRRLGFRRLLLERYYPDRAARLCGCEPDRIIQVARRFGAARSPVAMAGGDAVAGSNATSTAMAIHALNALVGAFDRPGGVVLPPRLPTTSLEPLDGPIAGTSLFAADGGSAAFGFDPVEALVERGVEGPQALEVLFVLGANPVHASPVGDRLREAIARIPTVVAFASFLDQTAACADIVLPTASFLEAWHEVTTPETVAVSVLGLGAPVVEPQFDARHAGDVLLDLARRVGSPVDTALPWPAYVDYLKHRLEGIWISGEGTAISGSFEESWVHFLEERGWRFLEHADPGEFWNDMVAAAGWWNPVRERGDWQRLFPTPSGRFEFFSSALERRLSELGRDADDTLGPEEAVDRGCAVLGLEASGDEACLPHFEPLREAGDGDVVLIPFRPITARGGHGVLSPMVMEMFGHSVLSGWETWMELAPETAAGLGFADGDTVAVESERGAIEAVVRVRPGAAPGAAHVALGLGQTGLGAVPRPIGANPIELLARVPDPLSGVLSTASSRVRLRLVHRRAHGGPAPFIEEES